MSFAMSAIGGQRGCHPGAELVIIEGMGHNLPGALWPEITSRIAALVQRVALIL